MKTVYLYKTIDIIKKDRLPAAEIFDGPGDDVRWIGRVIARSEDELTMITNRMENAVWIGEG